MIDRYWCKKCGDMQFTPDNGSYDPVHQAFSRGVLYEGLCNKCMSIKDIVGTIGSNGICEDGEYDALHGQYIVCCGCDKKETSRISVFTVGGYQYYRAIARNGWNMVKDKFICDKCYESYIDSLEKIYPKSLSEELIKDLKYYNKK